MNYASQSLNPIILSLFALIGLASGPISDKTGGNEMQKSTWGYVLPLQPLVLVDRRSESIPADWLYPAWNTQIINPDHFPIEGFMDTVLIQLTGRSECGFTMPVAGPVTSHFGYRHYHYHKGLDLDLRTGDPVYAAFDGMVRVAHYSSSFGNVVVIRHWNGLETLYAHLSKLLVQPGDEVESGQVIGKGGSTGHSTGSHLHWELHYKGLAFDPQKMVNVESGQLYNDNLLLSPADFKYFIPQSIFNLYSYQPAR